MEQSEAAQEIEALKAIWQEVEDRPPVWNSPAIAIPVCPLESLGEESSTRVTVVVIYNPRYPRVPPRLELESPTNLTDAEIAKLKRTLETKATELAGVGMVMVHDLLVLTNDFLSDKIGPAKSTTTAKKESLFQKMQEEEQRQREIREEEERAEERQQREEEARALEEEEARGEAQWAVVREKLEKEERERAASLGCVGASEGVILEASSGYLLDEDEGETNRGTSDAVPDARDEDDSSGSDDDGWMRDGHFTGTRNWAGDTAEGGGGVGGVGLGERSSWYRSQFKELENLGKGGFGTVVKVRNRVDRRLYAVKKVGLDPFDRETNRKIRREVTTISTLIHKNIVRYYQAWLEGGGGAYPAAVEEEHSDELPEDEYDDTCNTDEDDDDGRGETELGFFHTPGSSNSRKASKTVPRIGPQNGAAVRATSSDDWKADGNMPKSSSSVSSPTKINVSPSVSRTLPINGRPARSSGSRKVSPKRHGFRGAVGGSVKQGLDEVGVDASEEEEEEEAGLKGDGDFQKEADGTTAGVLGRKARRLLRKAFRKQKRLSKRKGKGAAAVAKGDEKATTDNNTAGDHARLSNPKRGSIGTTTPTKHLRAGGDSSTAGTYNSNDHDVSALPSGSLWARRRGGVTGDNSDSSDSRTSSGDGNGHHHAWSMDDDREEGAIVRDEAEGISDGSWGSGGGDYQPAGQGKLVSDAEFFQYCGSPERARQLSDAGQGYPPIPASWSSEDALMQLYEETRRDRDPAASSTSSFIAKPSTSLATKATEKNKKPPSLVAVDGVNDGHLSPREGGDARSHPLATPPPAGRMARATGERQYLYIQMEYCENTLRHLIDNGQVWKEEQRIWRLFRQMLEGVDFIHSKGIIHRDLTPPNVFLDGEENVKLGDFGLATSKKVRDKVVELQHKHAVGMSSDDDSVASLPARRGGARGWGSGYNSRLDLSTADGAVSVQTFPSVFGELSMSDTSQLTDGVGTGRCVEVMLFIQEHGNPCARPYIAPEQGARSGQYNHKADMWSLGVILFEMLAPKFSTLMERAEVMTTLRSGGDEQFPKAFEERVSENAKKVIRWLLKSDADARPTAAELLSSALLPPKLEVEATFLREALRVMGNPESDTFQAIVKALLHQETAEHVEHWYDNESLKTVSAQIPAEAAAVSFVCDGLRRVFETHGASPVNPPTLRPKPPPSLAPPLAATRGLVHLLDDKGAVVTLPGNLTAPFARFVARSGLTRLKRYQIDRVFHAGGPGPSGQAKEMWEADFDIVASGSTSAGGISTWLPSGLDNIRGGTMGGGTGGSGEPDIGSFEVAEAEAVLVISQVMGTFESFLGPWFLRLGNVKMAQAILELCHVPQDARPMVIGLFGRLARGSLTPAKALSEVEEKGGLSAEALLNVRPFLHSMGKDPFEALARMEVLVQRIPAVKSVMGLPSSGRRRDLTRKEAVRTKRSLRAFHEAREGLLALVEALGRLGLIHLPRDADEEAANPIARGRGEGPRRGSGNGGGGKGPKKKRHRQGDRTAGDGPRTNSADSRAGEPSDPDLKGSSHRGAGGRGNGSSAPIPVARIGGELEADSWDGGVCPVFVSLDLGLTQRQGNYASGTIFQAVLVGGGSLPGSGGERYSSTVAEGGRYDDLIARHRYHLRNMSSKLSGATLVCAVGVRFAVEKIASSLVTPTKESLSIAKNQQQRPGRAVDAVVCAGGGFEPQGLQERVLVAARLWAGGVRAEYLPTDALVRAGAGRGRGLEGISEACLSAGIPFVVVVRPHTLVAKKAVKVLSVLEKGGGQLEVPLDKLAEHVVDGLAALEDPMSTSSSQRTTSGPSGGYHHNSSSYHNQHHSHQHTTGVSSVTSGGVQARLALVDRGQPGLGSLEREKMSRHEYKTLSTLERRIGSLLDAAMAGPERAGSSSDGEGPLVLATEASFAAVRGLSTCYMLYGGDSKQVQELVSDHSEKKFLRNLVTALQDVEGGKRRIGKGQGKGGQSRQVFVYSLANELMDLVTFSGSGGLGLVSNSGSGGAGNKGGRGSR